MRTWIAALVIACPSVSNGQTNWVDAGMPQLQVPTNWIFSLPVDTSSGSLYVCGYLQLTPGQHALLRYSGGLWDTLGIFDQVVTTVERWQDSLIVGGGFTEVDGVPVSQVACYANGQWAAYGSLLDGSVEKLRVLNGSLYMAGTFDFADGHYCNGVAKRDGNEWVNLGLIPGLPSGTLIQDIAYYQGEVYACGPVSLNDGTKGIMRFNGTEWVAVGPGVLGGFSGLNAMAVYQGDLYAAGSVRLADGNAGHGIMRWDGDEWHAVGGHLQDGYCGYSFSAPVYDMVVHGDKLFVAGGIGCAGDVPAQRIAVWDGVQWCGLGTSFPMSATTTSLAFLQDTLYVAVAPANNINGIPVNGVAKWIGGAYEDTCSVPVSVQQQAMSTDQTLSTQERADGLFTVSGWDEACRTLTVHDAMGRCVLRLAIGSGQKSVLVDLVLAARGLYILRSDGHGVRVAKVLRG
ncbi:MAG: hypothetical protein IPM49_03185 [Flavobacteriales bacterium]|nr:hypothetical protein [Flavobacteriales bacterium]